MTAWGTVTQVKELRVRFRCGFCGRWTEARVERPPADDRGLVEVKHRCACGAEYDGSLSLDWVASEEVTT